MRKLAINKTYLLLLLLVAALLVPMLKSCGSDNTPPQPDTPMPDSKKGPMPAVQQVPVPPFNGDSAFVFVKKQIEFGTRQPGSEGHRKCGEWLAGEFRRMGMTVIEQKFQAQHYKGNTMDGVNIIAQYKPENPQRILLAAHWDSRFIADQDTKNQNKPILGADDGGSGVAILLELGRNTLQHSSTNAGKSGRYWGGSRSF